MSNIFKKTLIFLTCLLLAFTVFLCSYNIYLVNADEPVNPNPQPTSKIYLPLNFTGCVFGNLFLPFQLVFKSSDTYTLPYISFSDGQYARELSAIDLDDYSFYQVAFYQFNGTSSSATFRQQGLSMQFKFDNGVTSSTYTGTTYPTRYSNHFYSIIDSTVSPQRRYYTGEFSFFNYETFLYRLVLRFYPSGNSPLTGNYDSLFKYFDIPTSLFSFTTSDYQLGYQVGLNVGEQSGSYLSDTLIQDIRQQARSEGFNVGYQSGFNDGTTASTDYSFLGLITAVVDAPITMIFGHAENQGLLNLEILGVNVSSFILGLFFVALILKIISLIRRG